MMGSLGQMPHMDRPVTVQVHVHKERGIVCLLSVEAGAQILADVHIAYANDACESVHFRPTTTRRYKHTKHSKKSNTYLTRDTDHEPLDATGTCCTGEVSTASYCTCAPDPARPS